MSIPDEVEAYYIPSDRVKFEIHHQSDGSQNFWLFASVAAIELKEEDIAPLGELLTAWSKERKKKSFLRSTFQYVKNIDKTLKGGEK